MPITTNNCHETVILLLITYCYVFHCVTYSSRNWKVDRSCLQVLVTEMYKGKNGMSPMRMGKKKDQNNI